MNANVGMNYVVAAPVATYTVGTSITYGTGSRIAEGIGANISWERSDGHFYGDDVELDTDNGVTGVSLELELSGLTDAARVTLLGEVAVGSSTATYYDIQDTASPDVGVGYVRTMRSKAVGTAGSASYSYEAWWFYKMKFSIASEETRTKEQNIEWRVPTLEGIGAGVSLDSTGTLSFAQHKAFETLSAAKSYLNTKAGIS